MKDFIRSCIAGIRIILLSVVLFIPIIVWRILSISFSLIWPKIRTILWHIEGFFEEYFAISYSTYTYYKIISNILIAVICIALYFPLVRLFMRNAKEILKEQKVIK